MQVAVGESGQNGTALWSLGLTYADGRDQWSGADRFPSPLWLAINASGVRRLDRPL